MDHHDDDPSRPSQSYEPPKMESKPQATFLTKLYALLERPEYQSMIRWDANGEQIIVERPEQFALQVLPSIYRQSRFASFSDQLNMYGFVRTADLRGPTDDPDASTWTHPTLTRNSPPEVVANWSALDGWNLTGPTPVRAPAKAGDLSNFGKFTANSGLLKTMGPSSVIKKGDRGLDTPPPSTGGSISRATLGSNMYSLITKHDTKGPNNSSPSSRSTGRNQGRRMSPMGPPGPNRSASLSVGLGLNFPGGKNAPAPFGSMGNFSSTPSRLTSEERFAQSNTRDRAVSGGSSFMRNVPMSRSLSQGGVGGPNAVPPSPREAANRTRSQRGRARNDSLKPNGPQMSQQQQQQQQALLSGLEPVAALQQSENRWTPAARSKLSMDDSSPEYVERKVKGLLNKLTLENFDSVSNQIITWANKSENEKNGATLILVIKLVFEKATDEALWSEVYARLCRKMMEQISTTVQDDHIRNNAGEPIVGGDLFRKYLLNRCQEDFERGWSQKESAQAAVALKAADDKAAAEAASKAGGADDEPVLYSDEYYALLKAKRQGLGLVRFIGELFKLQMLTERIMHECIKKLLSKIDNPKEEEIESLQKLLTTVGQALDTPKAKGHMDIYFGRMQMLADNPNLGWRIRHLLLDVIELRGRSWRPRHAAGGPSTIAQFRQQDARERAAAGPTPVRAPAKAGDLSNFGKFTANSGPLKTMGPSSVFKKGDRGRDTPPPSTGPSMSRATSGSNMYSLLRAGGADAVDAMPARRKLNLLPRTVSWTNTNVDSAGDEDKPESDGQQVNVKTYPDKEAKAKVEENVKEFFNVRDVSEGEKSFAEMPDEHKSKLVDKLASKALDSKEADVKLVADLFEKVAGKSCPPSAFEEGLAGIIEFLDDTATDVPQAYTFMARMLRGSKLPQETVESLADKIFVDGDPLVKPRDKLLKAYAALA